MTFDDFQHLARLSVVGALEADEMAQFYAGRQMYGEQAEKFLEECRMLNAVFALNLRPCAPDPQTKVRLFERIRAQQEAERKEQQRPPAQQKRKMLFYSERIHFWGMGELAYKKLGGSSSARSFGKRVA